jgi:hypothetical protein
VREVLEWHLPEVTLDLCKSIDDRSESIDGFMENLKQAVQQDASVELQVCYSWALFLLANSMPPQHAHAKPCSTQQTEY